MNYEIHLFIIWSKAMDKAEEIITKINLRFDILDIFLIHWSSRLFSNNLSRFYGTNLPDGSIKEKHCGRGNFCLIIVRDPYPVYDICQTTAGKQRVNTNMFYAKQLFRSLTGGGHRIHGTNTPTETEHDLMLLLEKDTNQYIAKHSSQWDGQVKPIERDLPGADGWQSIEQLFRVLNATTSYLVLRNFEGFPQNYIVEDHGDIDLLCSDMVNMRFLSNAKPVFDNSQRVLHTVKINGKEILFDFRYIGDHYYDIQWQKDLIARRELSLNCFYRPSPKDYFYSLLYHAAIHKPKIQKDYIEKLCFLSKGFENLSPENFNHPANIKLILDKFLKTNGYLFTEPSDLSVFFNDSMVGKKKLSLGRILSTSTSLGTALFRIFSQSNNCATNSPEFAEKVYETHPILKRHFSPRRYCFIEAIPLAGINNVLEIGAESGILTRYLGERFKHVVAVENDAELAKCVEIRCDDLPSVSVISNIQEVIDIEKQFDLIILTGDCETWFHQEMTLAKITKLLRKTIGLLSHGGLLIFSVDNPLSKTGLFSSGPALSFLSEKSGDVLRSLHVNEIKEFLISEDMLNLHVFFMFPNHINPKTVFSQDAERRNLRAFGYWAATACEVEKENNFDLISAGELSHAGRLGDLSGGVCIMATHSGFSLPEIPWQVLSLSSAARPIVSQTITKVKRGDDLVVIKEGKSIHSPLFIFDPIKRYPVFEGCLIDAIILNNILSGSLKRMINTFQQVVEYWLTSFEWKQGHKTLPLLTVSGDREIIGDALDAIPRNLMISNGEIKFFDNEWKSVIPLPLSYLLYRSILSLLSNIKPEKIIKKLALNRIIEIKTFEDLIIFLINQMNLFSPLNQRHVLIFQQFEQRFQGFAQTGKYTDENPSLLELYQKVKASFATDDYGNIEKTMFQLEKYYKNYPEVEQLFASIYSTKQGEDRSEDIIKCSNRASI